MKTVLKRVVRVTETYAVLGHVNSTNPTYWNQNFSEDHRVRLTREEVTLEQLSEASALEVAMLREIEEG